MVKRFAATWLMALVLAGGAEAQDSERKNALSLQWGAGHIMRQDLVFSPFIHRDFSLTNFRLEYRREGKFVQRAGVDFAGFSPMVTDPYVFYVNGEEFSADPHVFTFIGVDYALSVPVYSDEKWNVAVGGVFNTDVQIGNYVYGRFGSFGYTALFGLGANADATYALSEKHSLGTTLRLPFLTWVARSPFLVNDDEFIANTAAFHGGLQTFANLIGDGNFATWGEVFQFTFELRYLYHVSERWDLGAVYEYEHIKVQAPRRLQSFQNNLRISGNYRF
jgi:hypothetical protein